MANKHQMTVEVALPPEKAEAALYEAFLAAGIQGVRGGGGVMQGTLPMSMSSYGESIDATIAHGPHGAVVAMQSRCALPTTLFDLGRNRKNLEKIVAALRTLAPVL